MKDPAQKADPATFEIVKNSLYKIAEEMRVVLAKTAYSPILKSAGDYSCGVFDARGEMVAQGPDLPIHLGSMPDAVRAVVAVFASDVHDGDVFVHNDPYFGGSHLPDVNVVRPAFHDGRLLGYACLRAHWPDVGSATPGSYGAVTQIFGEGLRIPPLRLISRGALNVDLEKLILANVRTPDERKGDLGAQLAATLRAIERLKALARRYGGAELIDYMAQVMDYSERLMRAALMDLPDGEGIFEDFCDGDGIADDASGADARFRICLSVKKTADRLIVDFAGTDRQVKGPMNAPLSVTASGVYCGLKTAVDPNNLIPPNSGCWRSIEVSARKGSVVNAEFPAPVVYANHEISHRVADMVMGALVNFMPEQVMACSQGTSAILTLGGVDPRSGRHYVSYETVKGGFGARPNKDGINCIASGISNTMNTPVEVLEMAFPVRVERYEVNPDFGRRRPLSWRLRRQARLAHAGGRRCDGRAVHGADDLATVRPARRQSRSGSRGDAHYSRRRDAPSAKQGRVCRAGGLGHRYDHARLGRFWPGRRAQSGRHRPRPARWLCERRGGATRLRRRQPGSIAESGRIGGRSVNYIPNSIEARDVASLVHMQTNLRRHQQEGPLVIARGEGCRVFDDSGRDYIESVAGLWCASLGFGSERLAKVAYEQMRKLGYYHLYRHRSTEPAIELAEALLKIAPVPMARVVFQCSGSEANDTAIKLAWYYWNAVGRAAAHQDHRAPDGLPRQHLRRRQPLGQAGHARRLRLAVRAVQAHRISRITTAATSQARPNWNFQSVWREALETLIQAEGPDTIAAFFAEPVMGAGGAILPPEGYFEKIQEVLRKYDILFVADEVICGFARTGEMWGSQTFGYAARHADLGQGAIRRHAADLGGADQRPHPRRDARAVGQVRQLCARLHLCGPSRWRPRSRSRCRRSMPRWTSSRAPNAWAPSCSRRSAGCKSHPLVGDVRGIGPDPRHGADARRRKTHSVRQQRSMSADGSTPRQSVTD